MSQLVSSWLARSAALRRPPAMSRPLPSSSSAASSPRSVASAPSLPAATPSSLLVSTVVSRRTFAAPAKGGKGGPAAPVKEVINAEVYRKKTFADYKPADLGLPTSIMMRPYVPQLSAFRDDEWLDVFRGHLEYGNYTQALRAHEKMKVWRVPPTLTQYRLLAQTHAQLYDTKAVLAAIEEARSLGLGDDGDMYGYLMMAYNISGLPREAVRVFESMVMRIGCQPSLLCWHGLLVAATQLGEPTDGLAVVGQMRRQGVEFTAETYLLVIDMLASCLELKAAMRYFNEMKQQPGMPPPDAFTYNKLMRLAGMRGNLRTAALLLDEMTSRQLMLPTEAVYNTWIAIFRSQGDTPTALRLMDEMISQRLTPSNEAYLLRLDSVLSRGNVKATLAVLADMRRLSYQPSRDAFELLISLRHKERDRVGVLETLNDLKAAGFAASARSYAAVIDLLEGHFVEGLVRMMREDAFVPDDAQRIALQTANIKFDDE